MSSTPSRCTRGAYSDASVPVSFQLPSVIPARFGVPRSFVSSRDERRSVHGTRGDPLLVAHTNRALARTVQLRAIVHVGLSLCSHIRTSRRAPRAARADPRPPLSDALEVDDTVYFSTESQDTLRLIPTDHNPPFSHSVWSGSESRASSRFGGRSEAPAEGLSLLRVPVRCQYDLTPPAPHYEQHMPPRVPSSDECSNLLLTLASDSGSPRPTVSHCFPLKVKLCMTYPHQVPCSGTASPED